MILLEVAKECRGSTYIKVDKLAPYGDESVEFLVNDELFYHAGDLTVPARPDSGMDMRDLARTMMNIRIRTKIIWREREASQMDWI